MGRIFSHCTFEIEDPDACTGCTADGGPMCGAVFIGDGEHDCVTPQDATPPDLKRVLGDALKKQLGK